MKQIRLSTIAALALATTLHAETPTSPKTKAPAESPEKHSFLDPLEGFARDSIFHPIAPFELVPGKDPNSWGFVIEPYIWAMGISGKSGIGGFPPANVNMDVRKILQNLDWAVMGKAEIRKGRWGILADGYYAALSGSEDLGSILYKSGNVQMQQGLASLSLSYRIIDDRRGFLDIYAGARYNYLGVQVDTTVDSAGVSSMTNRMADRLAAGISAKVTEIVQSKAGLIEADVKEAAKNELTSRVLTKIVDTPKDISEAVKVSELHKILDSRTGALAAYIEADADARVAAAKGKLTADLQSRVDAAKQKLASQLAGKIKNALPTHGAGDQWWVDPIVGLRGQVNITRWLFLAAQGDVGGFGAGSQIAWNTQATVGFNFTRNIFAELGYRYMYVDYNKNNFLYQMNTFGLFSSIGVKF
ncbi:MAG: hypothetical protein WCO94_04840 [Verrucomicrobiota bacterium]